MRFKISPMLREGHRWLLLGRGFLNFRKARLDGSVKYRTLEETASHLPGSIRGSEKLSLVGHSFGGMLALDYALDHPEQVCEVLTVASPFKGTQGIYLQNIMRLTGLYDKALYDLLPDLKVGVST